MTGLDSSDWPQGMTIVNNDEARNIRQQGMVREPRDSGYIYLAAEIESPHPLRKPGANKLQIIQQVKQMAKDVIRQTGVRRADVFNALIIPPNAEAVCRQEMQQHGYDFHIARFDLAVLVECKDVDSASTIRQSPEFLAMEQLLRDRSSYVYCIIASNPICIDDVDKDRDGIFLFNHFYSDGVSKQEDGANDVVVGVWEYTAGWWTAKVNLTNSTPLQPIAGESTEYALINHCRWDRLMDFLPSLIFRPTLKSFVVANFSANRMVSMPILYRLA